MRDLPLRESSTSPLQERTVLVNGPLLRIASTSHDTPPTIHSPRPITRNDTAEQLRLIEEEVEMSNELCGRLLGTVQQQHSAQIDRRGEWPFTNQTQPSDLVHTAQISSMSHVPGYPLQMDHEYRLLYAQQTSGDDTESSAPSTPNSPLSYFTSWADWAEKRGKGYGDPLPDSQRSSPSHEPVELPPLPPRMLRKKRTERPCPVSSRETSAESADDSEVGTRFTSSSWADWHEKRSKGYGHPLPDSRRSSPNHEPVELPPLPQRLALRTNNKTETAGPVSSRGTDAGLAIDSRLGAERHEPDRSLNEGVGIVLESHSLSTNQSHARNQTSTAFGERYAEEGHWIARSVPDSNPRYRFTIHSRHVNFAKSTSALDMIRAILNDRNEYKALLKVSLRTDVTARLRSCIFKAMLRLSKASGQCPSLLVIDDFQKEGDKPFASGGFCDIWKGHVGTKLVCLKIVRVYRDSDMERIVRDSMREAIIWRQLDHPNVLPFHGLYLQEHRICLISPWAANGSLTHYLDSTNIEDVNHETLSDKVSDIANGLGYLHSKKIVHADLKGDNVLITSHGRACIADFGLSRLTDSQVLVMTSTRALAGTLRWTAPEILIGEGQHTYRSDVYAFGCVCYEIYSHLRPFHDLRSDGAVILQVHLGKRPSRPGNTKLTDRIWSFIETCWATNPLQRPEPEWLIQMLECVLVLEGKDIPPPAPNWDHASLSAGIWSKLQQCNFDWTDAEDYLCRSASRAFQISRRM
uniref:Protein kinase domain-containing protein n=1 Tax=Moniliophthora roreri TaxID=221103 RepID=A0A0W0FIU1_MONRR